MANRFPIKKEDFEDIQDVNVKLNILFSGVTVIYERLDNRKWFDKAGSFLGGIIGGFGAIAAKTLIWK